MLMRCNIDIGSLPVFQIKKVIFVFFVVFIFAQGCSTVKPYSYIPKEGDGAISVFRRPAFNAGGVQAVVQVDGENIAKLFGEQYTSIKLGEGIHKVGVKGDGTVHIDLKEVIVKQNQILYFELEPNPARFWIFSTVAAFGIFGVIAENPLAFGIVLAPIIDIPAVKTFLLKESSEQEFKTAVEKFHEIKVE